MTCFAPGLRRAPGFFRSDPPVRGRRQPRFEQDCRSPVGVDSLRDGLAAGIANRGLEATSRQHGKRTDRENCIVSSLRRLWNDL